MLTKLVMVDFIAVVCSLVINLGGKSSEIQYSDQKFK